MPSGTRVEAAVAVVGAGPVGITVALELAAGGVDVVVIESGEESPDPAIQQLADADHWDEAVHASMDMAVRRQVGGTSTIWGGRCVPFDPVDFDRRPISGNASWPITYDDVVPYLQRTCDWFACGRAVFRASETHRLPASIVPGLAAAEVSTDALERWSLPTDFGTEYRARLRSHPQVRVLTGLTCTQIVLRPEERKIDHLACRSLDGRQVEVVARQTVIACGGLEGTRLLLASPDHEGRPIGDHAGHLGRWYMCHAEGVVADVHFNSDPRATIFDYERDVDGVYVRRRFTFERDFQRAEGLPNIAAWLANPELADVSHGSGPLSFAYLALVSPVGRLIAPKAQRASMTGVRVPGSPYGGVERSPARQHLRNVARQPWRTARFAASIGARRFLVRRRRVPGFFVPSETNTYPFQYHGEHLPHRESRVTLSGTRDAVGMPRLDIDLRFTDEDVDGVVRAHEAFDAYLRRTGVGGLEYLHHDVREAVRSRMGGGFHQAGTTRMSTRPDDGVVDADLAVHGLPDLHVASSSVFVTASQANSTFMAVLLAIRLADRLKAEHRRR